MPGATANSTVSSASPALTTSTLQRCRICRVKTLPICWTAALAGEGSSSRTDFVDSAGNAPTALAIRRPSESARFRLRVDLRIAGMTGACPIRAFGAKGNRACPVLADEGVQNPLNLPLRPSIHFGVHRRCYGDSWLGRRISEEPGMQRAPPLVPRGLNTSAEVLPKVQGFRGLCPQTTLTQFVPRHPPSWCRKLFVSPSSLQLGRSPAPSPPRATAHR